MIEKDAIKSLRDEAKSNPAANAVFHVFATRKRARGNVTVSALMQRMKAEGFLYEGAQYADLLKLLAKLGFGRLQTDPKGRVKALTDVKTKLQSIGMAACGSNDDLTASAFKPKRHYKDLLVTPSEPITAADAKPLPKAVKLTFQVNGKPFDISIPENATAEEVATVIFACGGTTNMR